MLSVLSCSLDSAHSHHPHPSLALSVSFGVNSSFPSSVFSVADCPLLQPGIFYFCASVHLNTLCCHLHVLKTYPCFQTQCGLHFP